MNNSFEKGNIFLDNIFSLGSEEDVQKRKIENTKKESLNKRKKIDKFLKLLFAKPSLLKESFLDRYTFDDKKKYTEDCNYNELIKLKKKLQKDSLEDIFNFFVYNNNYPNWFKYYSLRSIINIGSWDIEKKTYLKRTADTMSSYLELDKRVVDFIFNVIELKIQISDLTLSDDENNILKESKNPKKERKKIIKVKKDRIINNFIEKYNIGDKRDKFVDLLNSARFKDLYVFGELNIFKKEYHNIKDGIWKKYKKNSDFWNLINDIKGKNTGWCTLNGLAKEHLEKGDFYVYYLPDENKENKTKPVLAIRMEGDKIIETVGVEKDQSVPDVLKDILENKVDEIKKSN